MLGLNKQVKKQNKMKSTFEVWEKTIRQEFREQLIEIRDKKEVLKSVKCFLDCCKICVTHT